MKLYYAPGACSLATRISFHEVGRLIDFEQVDLASKLTEDGDDYTKLNPKGYVPLLILDDGQAITENVAILSLIAERHPQVAVEGPLGRTRLLEILSYLSSEVHVAFKPLWQDIDDLQKLVAARAVEERLELVAKQIQELYLFGPRFTVADAYLFVMLRWAAEVGIPRSAGLIAYSERVGERPSVRRSLAEEGLVAVPDNEDLLSIAQASVA